PSPPGSTRLAPCRQGPWPRPLPSTPCDRTVGKPLPSAPERQHRAPAPQTQRASCERPWTNPPASGEAARVPPSPRSRPLRQRGGWEHEPSDEPGEVSRRASCAVKRWLKRSCRRSVILSSSKHDDTTPP